MENQKPIVGDNSSHIAWHPAFVEALQMELDAYKDVLEFLPEYQLTSEPLKIDCVVIKKLKDVDIQKNIAKIFREWNLVECKSPTDNVSIADFYKVYGYACLYASFNNLPITGLTVTFIESRYPQKLIAHLKEERNYKIEETSSGVDNISGDILPIQIIDNRRLSEEENLWLKSLDNRLDSLRIKKIGIEAHRDRKSARLMAYMDVLARANPVALKEALDMSTATVEQVLEEAGWIAKWEARGEENKAITIAKNLLNLGIPLDTVVSATQLAPEKVKALYP